MLPQMLLIHPRRCMADSGSTRPFLCRKDYSCVQRGRERSAMFPRGESSMLPLVLLRPPPMVHGRQGDYPHIPARTLSDNSRTPQISIQSGTTCV